MKSAVICALAFIFLVNGLSGIHAQISTRIRVPYKHLLRVRSIENLPVCKPGTTRMEDCNTCFCGATGFEWTCTEIGCSDGVAKIPGDTITQSTGDNPTNRIRREEIQARPNTETQVQPCVLGTTKNEDCNSCFCTEAGWACTKKGCYVPISGAENPGDTIIQPHGDNPSSRVKRGEIQSQPNTETQVQPCVLGTTKKEDCNSCFCTEAGWACTERGCYVPIRGGENPGDTMIQSHGNNPSSRIRREEIQAEPNTETRDQTCVVGSTERRDCNSCFCTEAGWACTLIGCLPSGFIVPPGTQPVKVAH